MKRRGFATGGQAPTLPAPAQLPGGDQAATSTRPAYAAPHTGAEAVGAARSLLEDSAVAVAEVAGLPARLLVGVEGQHVGAPAPWTLVCSSPAGELSVWTNARASFELARGARVPAFVGGELVALEMGARADRVTRAQGAEWLARKREQAGWRLTTEAACGGVWPDRLPTGDYGWSVGRVLAAAGMHIVWVGVGDELPPLASLGVVPLLGVP